MASRPKGLQAELLAVLGHLLLAALVFRDLLLGGVLYVRDLSSQYHPDYAFVAGALRQGVFPLWNPTIHAGAPWLLAYPLDLLLLLIGGPRLALGLGVVLQLAFAMTGASWLARERGREPLPAFLAGVFYGLSGTLLSLVNLLPLFEGAAWLPWVVAAALRVLRRRDSRSVALLALALALQVSTLAVETTAQAALALLVLAPLGSLRRGFRHAAAGAGLAAVLAAPVVAGVGALMAGTARGAGFDSAVGYGFSASPLVLLEALLPRFFGNAHSFANATYWGQTLFPDGYPYLLSLYLGLSVLLLAAWGRDVRCVVLAILSLLLALGENGPLRLVLAPWLVFFRAPVKFCLLATLAASLLAAEGVARARGSRPGWWVLVPGSACLAAAVAFAAWPEVVVRWTSSAIPELLVAGGRTVAASIWPRALALSGALALATGLALRGGSRWAALAGVAAAIDLLVVNGPINPVAPARFYDLRPEVARLVAVVEAASPARVFSYGTAYAGPVPWHPAIAEADDVVWRYYVDRQSLLPRTFALDGLEGAFEVDRTGWAPARSSLTVADTAAARLPAVAERLRRANVRFLWSFESLPAELVEERGRAMLPEMLTPLRLYELRGAWPRVFWVPSLEGGPFEAPTGESGIRIEYSRLNPHAVALKARTPPGFVVVLDGYHPAWHARSEAGAVPLRPFGERYLALPTPGGEQAFELRFEPAWRLPALLAGAVGLFGVGILGWPRGPRAAPGIT